MEYVLGLIHVIVQQDIMGVYVNIQSVHLHVKIMVLVQVTKQVLFNIELLYEYIIIAPNTCACLPGYNGSYCQYRTYYSCVFSTLLLTYNVVSILAICNPSCLNGGVCVAVNTCNCTYDVWIGPICQTRTDNYGQRTFC